MGHSYQDTGLYKIQSARRSAPNADYPASNWKTVRGTGKGLTVEEATRQLATLKRLHPELLFRGWPVTTGRKIQH